MTQNVKQLNSFTDQKCLFCLMDEFDESDPLRFIGMAHLITFAKQDGITPRRMQRNRVEATWKHLTSASTRRVFRLDAICTLCPGELTYCGQLIAHQKIWVFLRTQVELLDYEAVNYIYSRTGLARMFFLRFQESLKTSRSNLV